MKPIFILFFLAGLFLISSCNEEESDSDTSSSYTFDLFGDSDENTDDLLVIQKNQIREELLIDVYTEYKTVANWFKSNPKELSNLNGEFYKILKCTKQVNETITNVSFEDESERGTYMYFYNTDDFFYIVELQVFDHLVNCVNVRRIADGYGSQAMHDMIYNDKKEIIKEVFQNDVNPSLDINDEKAQFEFSAKLNGKKYVNTLYLANY